METPIEQDAVYFYAVSRLEGIGPQLLLRLVSAFSTPHALLQASSEDLAQYVNPSAAHRLFQRLHQDTSFWEQQVALARKKMQQQVQAEIMPLPFTSPWYPPLLKRIADPPAMLYVKGNRDILQQTKTVAIVGTREPTQEGIQIAHQIALYLAQHTYCIVSGLAKGIDTAAHKGALEGHGPTIAVLGTPLDTIYPAENKGLAEMILQEGGTLISELPMGERSFRTAFVRRDRIQSGLSLAVLPIQTAKEGGTMHTIAFAQSQQRLILCPLPDTSKTHGKQYEGIQLLLKEKHPKVQGFTVTREQNYEKLEAILERFQHHMLSGIRESDSPGALPPIVDVFSHSMPSEKKGEEKAHQDDLFAPTSPAPQIQDPKVVEQDALISAALPESPSPQRETMPKPTSRSSLQTTHAMWTKDAPKRVERVPGRSTPPRPTQLSLLQSGLDMH